MVDLLAWCQSLENTPMSAAIRDSIWLFPAIETLHLIGIVALVGSTSILDLRLLGWTFKKTSVAKLTHQALPWAWTGFLSQLITGFFMFASEASRVYVNPAFRLKMLMIVAAGINALIFHMTTRTRVADPEDRSTPLGAKLAGLSSILLWFGIVIAGRM